MGSVERSPRRSDRIWLMAGLVLSLIPMAAAVSIAFIFDGWFGVRSPVHTKWPLAVACAALVAFFVLPNKVDGIPMGVASATGLGIAAFGAAMLGPDGAVAYASAAMVAAMSVFIPIVAALRGDFRRFHKGVAWVGLVVLVLGACVLFLLARPYLRSGVEPAILIALLGLIGCIPPVSLCALRLKTVD